MDNAIISSSPKTLDESTTTILQSTLTTPTSVLTNSSSSALPRGLNTTSASIQVIASKHTYKGKSLNEVTPRDLTGEAIKNKADTKGLCPKCKTSRKLTSGGLIWRHGPRNFTCEGSGQRPTAIETGSSEGTKRNSRDKH